jgi:N-methylhydantoinase A
MEADFPDVPVARRVAHSVTHHGVTIEDPYAWLRDPAYPRVNDPDVLGYLNAENFLGGRAKLDAAAAEAAVDKIAAALGVDRMTAAEGIHRVINSRMAEGVRLVSVRGGIDPRRYALLSFGGAAGLHITDIARQLDLRRVIVPRLAAVLSAWGMLATDLRYELARTHIGDASALAPDDLRRMFDEMEADGRARLTAARFEGPVRTRRSADMRYGEQIFEIAVELDQVDWSRGDLVQQMAEAFHARHEELYTYALRDQDAVLVNGRVAAIGALPALPGEPPSQAAKPSAPLARRRVYLGAWQEVPVFAFDGLGAGQIVEGPAIVESSTTTVLLRAGDRAQTTPLGWLDISLQT